MNIGMLWADFDPKVDLKTKIGRAMDYYQKKYGNQANTCFVNPSMLDETKIQGIEIRVHKSILPNHLWIGNIDENN